jgi:hypothetical protein
VLVFCVCLCFCVCGVCVCVGRGPRRLGGPGRVCCVCVCVTVWLRGCVCPWKSPDVGNLTNTHTHTHTRTHTHIHIHTAPARSAAVIESLAYCLDVTDLARNSHGIPWPTDAAEAELVSVSQ